MTLRFFGRLIAHIIRHFLDQSAKSRVLNSRQKMVLNLKSLCSWLFAHTFRLPFVSRFAFPVFESGLLYEESTIPQYSTICNFRCPHWPTRQMYINPRFWSPGFRYISDTDILIACACFNVGYQLLLMIQMIMDPSKLMPDAEWSKLPTIQASSKLVQTVCFTYVHKRHCMRHVDTVPGNGWASLQLYRPFI